MSVITDLAHIIDQARTAFASATRPADLENEKAKFLGKDGVLTAELKALGKLPIEEKKTRGAQVNAVRVQVEQLLNEARQALADAELNARLSTEKLDVTLPGRGLNRGGVHPVTRVTRRVEAIFRSMGFDVADGPEIGNDWYNFTSLNSPENHPARSMQDTFYVVDKDERGNPLVLRTHTSPMQVRYARTQVAKMNAGTLKKGSPIKVIAPGRTYRVDSDATHSPMFHQVEGLWIAEAVSFADLKAVYTAFLQKFFETEDLQTRFRPSYFPFTEPSVEIDMAFGSGPNAGKWLEISGAGQVHPTVIRNFGLDPEQYMGFAFGSGLERLAMLRYGVNDLRLFYENDLRFLGQFQ